MADSNPRIKVIVATHKEYPMPSDGLYMPLHVGASIPNPATGKLNDFGYVKDCTGENISEKNPQYCELTGLYWIWKNDKHDVVGLCHYRRFFTSNRLSRNPKHYLTIGQAEHLLKKYDIIVPEPKYTVFKTTYEFYSKYYYVKDLDIVREVISDMCPEYIDAFDQVMKQHCSYAWNMMIAKREILDSYCSWLFPIIEETEKRTDISDYDQLQSRLYGFLAERLLNVWINMNQMKVCEIPVVNTEENRMVFLRRIPMEILSDYLYKEHK